MQSTEIQWTEKSWNPVRGCTRVSEGCTRCYAERQAARYSGPGLPFEGFAANTPAGPRWTGKVELIPEKLGEPLRMRKPARIFVNSMSDLFHEGLTDGQILRVFEVMARCPQHTFQVLTKRPARMLDWFRKWNDLEGEDWSFKGARGPDATRAAHPSGRGQMFAEYLESMGTPPPGCAYPTFDWLEGMLRWPRADGYLWHNVWLGTSVEDQATADERIPLLLQCPAAVRWVSAEPLLGPIDLMALRVGPTRRLDALHAYQEWRQPDESTWYNHQRSGPTLDWVVVGGESGPGARPMHPGWAEQIRDACVAAGVPFFFKQWGGHAPACRNFIGAFWMDHDGTRASCHVHPSGPGGFGLAPNGTARQWVCMSPSNKRDAGRLLDGRTWDEMPEVRCA